MQSYLRFTVSGVSGTVQNARLRVYAYDGTTNGPSVYSSSSSWSETGITWNNRPGLTSGAVDDKGYIATNTWVEYNVTQLVTGSGNGTYTFVLSTTSTDGSHFRSRQGSQPPQLVITTN
jgi:hypothetical protein